MKLRLNHKLGQMLSRIQPTRRGGCDGQARRTVRKNATNRNLALVCNRGVCLANLIDKVQLFARGVVPIAARPSGYLFAFIGHSADAIGWLMGRPSGRQVTMGNQVFLRQQVFFRQLYPRSKFPGRNVI